MRDSSERTSGQLHAFGSLAFSNPAVKVPTKPLLVLCYLRLEGHQSRPELADLFWSHLAGQRTKKGERKDYSNYSVARAVLKRELGIDIEDAAQIAALPCDVTAFAQALDEGRLEDALNFYKRGRLLGDIEMNARLELSSEFLAWLDAKRAALAQRAQAALLGTAQDPRSRDCAVRCAEEIYEVERKGENFGVLAQFYGLLIQLASPLAHDARQRLSSCLTELLEEGFLEPFQLYLVLSSQSPPNLATAQVATNLSPQVGAACLAELKRVGLLNHENGVVDSTVAELYFEQHAEEKLALLRTLADSTPAEQVFPISQMMFEASHTFGGVGYWDSARAAYASKANTLAEAEDYQAAADVLTQFLQAEVDNQQAPYPETRALHAHALARLGRYPPRKG